jgi:6-phosphogluconolactonase
MKRLTQLFLLPIFAIILSCNPPQKAPSRLYVGTYTNKGGDGIVTYHMDHENGGLTKIGTSVFIKNPNFISILPDKKGLLVVGRPNDFTGEAGENFVSLYHFNNADSLVRTATQATGGKGACHVSYNENGRNIYVASYGSGEFSYLPLLKDNTIGNANVLKPGTAAHVDSGRQEAPHAHAMIPGPSGKFIYGTDLGADRIFVFKHGEDGFMLHTEIITAPGSGPRHLTFHPTEPLMAVLNELNSTVTLYTADADGCFTIEGQTISMLPEGFDEFSKAADIHFSPDGKFLYGSNRGYDSIICYAYSNQQLQVVDWTTHHIKWPRNFVIDPSGQFLLVANQNSNSIAVFKRDSTTGKLQLTHLEENIIEPVCLKFL